MEKKLENILRSVTPLDEAAMEEARKRQAQLAKPPGSLGRLEELSIQLAGITGKVHNSLDKKHLLVFCADNGVYAEGVASSPRSVTLMQTINLTRAKTGASVLAKHVGAGITVCDVGVIGNPISVEGQAYGGASHSIGFALSENYDDVKKHANMKGAGIPYATDTPDDLRLVCCVTPRTCLDHGSAGCSEGFQSAGHMAVINGIYRACGVRIYELPATPDKIKAGLDILAKGGKIEPPAPYFLGNDLYDELEEIKANPV